MAKVMTYDSKFMSYEHFGEVLDFETVNQYVCAVKQLICTQRSEGLIILKADDIVTDGLKQFIKEVNTCKDQNIYISVPVDSLR